MLQKMSAAAAAFSVCGSQQFLGMTGSVIEGGAGGQSPEIMSAGGRAGRELSFLMDEAVLGP